MYGWGEGGGGDRCDEDEEEVRPNRVSDGVMMCGGGTNGRPLKRFV